MEIKYNSKGKIILTHNGQSTVDGFHDEIMEVKETII